MKPARIPLAVALAAVLGLLAACATRPATVAANEHSAGLAQCAQVTGSRIRPKNTDCSAPGYPYRSYSAEQLQGTGEIDLVEALRQIDPAFR